MAAALPGRHCMTSPAGTGRIEADSLQTNENDQDIPRVRGMSLERKLPLLMTGVLLAILGGGVLLAYREIRSAAIVVSVNRLKQVATSLAAAAATSAPRVSELFRNAARDDAVRGALAARPSRADLRRVSAVLDGLDTPGDSGIRTELRSADGRVIATAGDSEVMHHRPATSAVVTGPDSLSVGAFYAIEDRVYYWYTRPVMIDGVRAGTIAQRRRLNAQPATEANIASLTGQQSQVLFRNADGSLWTTLAGKPVDPPTDAEGDANFRTVLHPAVAGTDRVVLNEMAVDGTPWIVVLELPVTALASGPREMLRRFAAMSVILLLVGAVALWLISRRITSPLARLTAAAEGIAKGDYSQRVNPRGDYEIARLGASFNRMAGEIETANKKLHESAGAAADAQQAAEAANASKSNFLAAMSHELRTPLNAIAGYVELLELELRGPLTTEQRTDLGRVKRSQKYLLGLIEEILVFSQLDAQRLAFNITEVSVDAVVRDAEAMVDQQIKAKGIQYRYVGCPEDLLVRADRDKMQQVLINLIVNGTKYTDPGGSITVSCDTAGDRVRVHVADTGVGIPEEKLNHIFDAFVQLDRSLNQPREGVGLGLTISRDLARAMGGDLHVESIVGVGSTFTLELPTAHPVPEHTPALELQSGFVVGS